MSKIESSAGKALYEKMEAEGYGYLLYLFEK